MELKQTMITGTGLFVPEHTIANDELVHSFNLYVNLFNEEHADEIKKGLIRPLEESSEAFIVKASGIERRHVINKEGILNPSIMAPQLTVRSNEELSYQAEMGVKAAKQALESAARSAPEIDAIIVACSNFERPYPAIAIEIQAALGLKKGFAFDLNVACSSATFGLHMANDLIRSGSARKVLVINPEICSAHLNYRDRDSHFIFGDACTAVLVEDSLCRSHSTSNSHQPAFTLLGSKLLTQFSSNIRNNFGFLNRTCPETQNSPDKLFKQNGRAVFKEVVPLVAQLIKDQLQEMNLQPQQLKRLWLHQANINMSRLICEKVLGREPSPEEAPSALSEYANTSSAGSIIAFHLFQQDLQKGDYGIICSFGAGYSIGSLVLQKSF